MILLNDFIQTVKLLSDFSFMLYAIPYVLNKYLTCYLTKFYEWGWTAWNSIARQSFARHFWQQINCSTQNWSTARIQLILAQLDSSSWQKSDKWSTLSSSWQKSVNCSTLSSSWHIFLVWHINWKSQFFTYRNGQ